MDARGVSTVVDELAELAPGARLAGLLESLDPALVADDDLTELIAARARLIAHERAWMLMEILRVARRVRTRKYGADLVAITLHCSLRWAQSQIDLAEGLAALPMVFEALLAGRIDEARAAAFVDGLAQVQDRGLAAAIANRLLARAPRWTVAELRERLRYHVDRKDPAAARRRYCKRVAGRDVLLVDDREGTATVAGCSLPVDRASAAFDRVDRLARCARAAGDPRTLAQLRADAYLDLLSGTPFQLAPSVDPLTASADADYRDGHRPEPVDPRALDEPDEEPVGAYDYETATVPETDRVWLAESGSEAPDSRFGTWNPDRADPTMKRFAVGVLPADRCACGGTLPAQRPGRADVTVKLTTLAGLDEHPALMADLGPVPADVARQIAFDRDANPVWRYSVVDEHGILLQHGLIADRTKPSHSRFQTGNPDGPMCICPRVQPADRRGIVEIQLTPATLAELAADPTRSSDLAAVVAEIAAQVASGTRANQPDTQSIVDGCAQRLFNAEEAAFIKARDKTCRTPHCRRKASRCDIDHTIPYSQGGPSHRSNGDALCRRHHVMRDHPGFHRTRRGHCVVWTTPDGRTHTVGPDKDIALTDDA